ncbi:MAG: esterase/lipase family protein [Mycobacteriaceae bacterium]
MIIWAKKTRIRLLARALVVTILSLTGCLQFLPSAHATRCQASVLLIHDIASDSTELDVLKAAIERPERCVHSFTYGISLATSALSAHGRTIAGFTPIEDSAAELVPVIAKIRDNYDGPIDIVAYGVGALVTQYYLQQENLSHTSSKPHIRSLTSIAPMWNGTNIGYLATIEDISRHLGTFDFILSIEAPIVDPLCGACRQIISGSDFLLNLHSQGLVSPDVIYTNIISETDLLIVPTSSAEVSGMKTIKLQDHNSNNASHHFQLINDTLVQELINETLRNIE